jgi:prepilin-type N-terminal cleavage/methylation domain-containing protein
MKKRDGFTLVELLVVAIVGSLLVLAVYQVLITNQRTYTLQNSKVQAQQATRATMEILFSELREISAGGGDIIDFASDSLGIRAMRKVGVVCDNFPTTFGSTPQLLVRRVSDAFEVGDSVFVFADNDEYITSDDTWIEATLTATDTTVLCDATFPAQRMTFAGQSGTFEADSVRVGAPIRSYTRYSYSLGTYNGDTFLGRTEAGGDWVPLVGPLAGAQGRPALEMTYLDGNGNVTANAADIRRIVIMVRAFTDAVDPATGNPVVDSLSTSIYMRN